MRRVTRWAVEVLFVLVCSLGSGVANASPLCGSDAVDSAQKKKYLSLVFAGEDLRTPISMFGHTFLVFHDEEEPEPDSVVLEFLGLTKDESFSSIKAFLGILPGEFRWSCLSDKEFLYDLENRDLWFYRTFLTASEKSALIQRATTQQSDYGFARGNCADRIHDLLLMAVNRSDPVEFIHEPIKGIRYLQARKIVSREGSHRSSSLKTLHRAYDDLSLDERGAFASVLRGDGYAVVTPSTAHALSRYVNFQYRREPVLERREFLFGLKSRFVQSSTVATSLAASDAITYSSLRSVSVLGAADGFEFRFSPGVQNRWSFHDGAFAHSDLEYATVSIGVRNGGPFLREVTVLRIDALLGGDVFEPSLVRFFDLSYEETRATDSVSQKNFVAEFGAGWGFSPTQSLAIGGVPMLGIRHSIKSRDTADSTVAELGIRLKFSFIDKDFGSYSFTYMTLFESKEKSRVKGTIDLIPFRSGFWSWGGKYTFDQDGGVAAMVLSYRF